MNLSNWIRDKCLKTGDRRRARRKREPAFAAGKSALRGVERCEDRRLLTFHLWKIDQVFSSADGKVQFIELHDPANGESHLAGHSISSNENTFAFPANLPTDATANMHFLIGTTDYAKQSGAVTPDYTVPDNFFSVAGDTINYADVNIVTFAAGQLPTDGKASLLFNPDESISGTSATNSETDLVPGTTGSISLAVHVNQAPTINPIPDPATILPSSPQQTIDLSGITGGAGETENLTVTAASDNTALIPSPSVTYTSPNSTGTLSYTPVAGAQGTATITVTVHDDGGTANGGIDTTTRTFHVTVTQVNDAPTIDVIPDPPPILPSSGQQSVNLAGITAGLNETQHLTVTAISDNTALIPNPTVSYSSPNSTGTLFYTPVAGARGTATITVTVHDDGGTANSGVNTTTRSFTVHVGVTPTQLYVQHLYEDLLHREAGNDELTFWAGKLAAGASNGDVARGLIGSQEHEQLVVHSLYTNLLGRTADTAGLSFFSSQLSAGGDEGATIAAIAATDEFFSRAGRSNRGVVNALYHDLLGRAGEAAGMAYWQSLLAGGASQHDVAMGFVISHEFHGLQVDDPSARFAAEPGWYQTYLHRNGDAGGTSFFVGQLAEGNSAQTVQLELLATAEYVNRAN
ncbi:MAG TPA: DUF4214 domain-containing protein [Pirellulales bacterium]|nr:DUF4214 domain-containing protein [Pirellulales bacterium]